jgi:PPP family 3-phenylpropionic acid transporter
MNPRIDVREDQRRAKLHEARRDRDVRILFVVAGAAGAAILPFFTLFLEDRGITPDHIGLILAAQALAAVTAAPIWGHHADRRIGAAKALVTSLLITACLSLGLLVTGVSVVFTALLAAALAAAAAPVTALADSIALATLGPDRTIEYGRIRRFTSGGWAVAIICFGALYQRAGLEPLPVVYAAAVLAYAATASRFARVPEMLVAGADFPAPDTARDRRRLGAVGLVFRSSPRLLPFLSGLLLVSTATASANGFVPLRMLGPGGGPWLVGLAAGIAAVVEIPVFGAAARLARRVHVRHVYLAGVSVTVLQLLAWSTIERPTAVAAVRMVGGVALALTYGSIVILTDRTVPHHLRSTGMALLQIASLGIGPIVGTAVGGLVYVHLGPPTLFAGTATVAATGGLIAWWSQR